MNQTSKPARNAPAPKPDSAPGASVTYSVSVAADKAGGRLDRLLADALPDLSRSRLKALIEQGAVAKADRAVTDPSHKTRAGDVYAVAVPPALPAEPAAQAMDLAILYEDDDLIVIDKPAGLVVHPAPGNPDRTLVNALLAHCGPSLKGIGGVGRPGIVHRLDKDTSGLMVVAKTEAAHQGLARQFAAHTLERAYYALVWGVPRPAKGRIEGNIGRSPRNRKKMAVLARGGRPAATRYKVIETYGATASLVECRLETGRTHQIRVHMAHIGHPVVGDPLYGRRGGRAGGDPLATKLSTANTQVLHAYLLGFNHPKTAKALRFEGKIPSKFNDLVTIL